MLIYTKAKLSLRRVTCNVIRVTRFENDSIPDLFLFTLSTRWLLMAERNELKPISQRGEIIPTASALEHLGYALIK